MDNVIIESVQSIFNINTHSHKEMAPFACIDDIVYVDRAWWESIFINLRIKLIISFGNYFGYAIRDKIPEKAIRTGNAFEKFLTAYHTIFSIENWYECRQDCSISNIDKVGIFKLCEIKTFTLEDIKECYNSILLTHFIKYLEKNKETGIYISLDKGKISKKSPKFNLEEVITEIVKNPEASILYMVPWCYEITKSEEYRVFVHDNHISAISQKECYKYVGLTLEKISILVKIIHQYIKNLKNKICYNTYVADLWTTQGTIQLIKILPGESWTNTESKLFNWETDFEKLNQTEKTFVKYIDIKSPMIRPLGESTESLIF